MLTDLDPTAGAADPHAGAIEEIRKLLAEVVAKQLAEKGSPKPAAVSVEAVKAEPDADDGDDAKVDDENATEDEPADKADDSEDEPKEEPHPLHVLAMKKMDQLIKPKKG